MPNLSQEAGSRSSWCCRSRGYTATSTISFEKCVLRVIPRGHLVWEGLQLGSGLDVRLIYSKAVEVGGEVIGLDDDWNLTVPLARFLRMNQRLVPERLAHIEGIMQSYRNHYLDESRAKSNVLTYRFFTNVYDLPRDPTRLAESSITHEKDIRVRQLMLGCEKALETTYDRLSAVTKTKVATWWYIFWVSVLSGIRALGLMLSIGLRMTFGGRTTRRSKPSRSTQLTSTHIIPPRSPIDRYRGPYWGSS